MEVSEVQHRLLRLCAVRLDGESPDWSVLAREAVAAGSLDGLAEGRLEERSAAAKRTAALLRRGMAHEDAWRARVDEELALASGVGARLVTVLDDAYPANLRRIGNLPPFLFVRGTGWEAAGGGWETADARSVAVVGSRQPSPEGVRRASQLAARLVDHGVVVVSGLARGIDAAAHRATLDRGGRTIAVVGTGTTRTYPREHAELADEIAERGVVVSQFWPSAGPAKWTFPRRNVVISGMAQGTVVVEASAASGSRLQARLALEHGRMVWLLRSLVASQPWAQALVAERGAREVSSAEEIVAALTSPRPTTPPRGAQAAGAAGAAGAARQLTLSLQ